MKALLNDLAGDVSNCSSSRVRTFLINGGGITRITNSEFSGYEFF